MKTIDLYMAGQLLRAALIAIFAMSIPVILITLNAQVPIFSMPASLLWPMLLAISCIIIFHTMPILAAFAIAWVYARFWTEGVVVTLFMAGRSKLGVAAPALLLALACTLAGYITSNLLKPVSEKTIHNVMHDLRQDMNFDLLKYGEFNNFFNGKIVIFIKKKVNNKLFEDVYLSNYKKIKGKSYGYREHYYSKFAIKSGDDDEKLVLVQGSMIDDRRNNDRIKFKYLTWQAGDDTASSRTRVFYDELQTTDFLSARQAAFKKKASSNVWIREAVKRFVLPLLSLTYTVLVLGLLHLFGAMMGRSGRVNLVVGIICGVIFAIHLPVVFLIEAISLQGMPAAVLVVGLILAQLLIGIVIFTGSQNLKFQTFCFSLLTRLSKLIPLSFIFPSQFKNGTSSK